MPEPVVPLTASLSLSNRSSTSRWCRFICLTMALRLMAKRSWGVSSVGKEAMPSSFDDVTQETVRNACASLSIWALNSGKRSLFKGFMAITAAMTASIRAKPGTATSIQWN